MNDAVTQFLLTWKRFGKKVFTRRNVKIALAALMGFLVLDSVYLYSRVPDWANYAHGAIPKSRFMQQYERDRTTQRDWPALRWQPISIDSMPKLLRRAVLVAEDSRFYDHNGFDLSAFQLAMEHNLEKGKMAYGASTISQQTVKNLFLNPSRNPLRKWHEFVLTLKMEQRLSKSRILEIYLNIAEFGRGIYGVEAAAQYYYGKSAADLTLAEAAGLAATLPSPVKSNPATRSKFFVRHRDTILARVTPRAPAAETVGSALPVLESDAVLTTIGEQPQGISLESQQSVLDAMPSTASRTEYGEELLTDETKTQSGSGEKQQYILEDTLSVDTAGSSDISLTPETSNSIESDSALPEGGSAITTPDRQ